MRIATGLIGTAILALMFLTACKSAQPAYDGSFDTGKTRDAYSYDTHDLGYGDTSQSVQERK